jgi:hypothetical protein
MELDHEITIIGSASMNILKTLKKIYIWKVDD